MAKAILEFDLNDFDDKLEHKRAVNATNAYLALFNINSLFRSMIKNEIFNDKELSDVEYDLIDKLQDEVCNIVDEYVNMEDLP
jgi:hypothetical protein